MTSGNTETVENGQRDESTYTPRSQSSSSSDVPGEEELSSKQSDNTDGQKQQQESSNPHDKPCTICGTRRGVLVRCQIDETGKWHFVCPGKCWKSVSGGEIDAKGHKEEFPHYKYGGMWKNKHEDGPLNAKKPKKKKKPGKEQGIDTQGDV